LCAEYHDLLLKHDFGSQWENLPAEPREWTDWDTRVHKVVALRDLADRKVRLTERESMERYLTIKPMDKPSRSAYLYGRGLGVWLKLRLRADNLPLMTVLARTSTPRMTTHCARCALCATGASEDVQHFLTECPALQPEREKLWADMVQAMRPSTEESMLARRIIIIIISKVNTAYRGPRWGSA